MGTIDTCLLWAAAVLTVMLTVGLVGLVFIATLAFGG